MSVELSLAASISVVVALAVLGALLIGAYLLANRLDRLHIRTDLAGESLFGVLGRRHTVASAVVRELQEAAPDVAGDLDRHLVEARGFAPEDVLVPDSRTAQPRAEYVENAIGVVLGRVDRTLLSGALDAELTDVTDRLEMARRFYNDAVRDTRALRELWVVRVFRLAGRAPMPDYVELVGPPEQSR